MPSIHGASDEPVNPGRFRAMQQSVQRRLISQVERVPDALAAGFIDGRGRIVWRTRQQLHRRAGLLAMHFAEAGLRAGEVCILALPSKEYCATAVLATLRLGAVPLLIAPPIVRGLHSSLADTLARTIRKTRARIVVCDTGLRDDLEGIHSATRVVSGEFDLDEEADVPLPEPQPRSDAVVGLQLTSGTTGKPRVCVWTHSAVLASLDAMRAAMKLSADDLCYNWTPLYHDMGLVNNFLLCQTCGIPLAMLSPQDFIRRPALWLRGLFETGATLTWSPNFGFAITARTVRDSEIAGVRLDRVRAWWNAAERVHLDTLRIFAKRFVSVGLQLSALKTNFGCAENVGGATFSDPDRMFKHEWIDRNALQTRRVAVRTHGHREADGVVPIVGVGQPAPGLEVVILSRRGDPLPDGHVGEIALRTPSRMLGYLRDRRATRLAIRGELLRTGDVGYSRDGELYWVGRVRERIAVRGRKLDPSDLETTLLRIPALRPGCFAAFGVEDPEQGTERLVVVAELRQGSLPPLPEVARTIRDRVTSEVGVEVGDILLLPRGSMTKTSSGKRRHRHYRQLYLDRKLHRLALDADQRSGLIEESRDASTREQQRVHHG